MLNFATGEPGKVRVRDLERVVGIFAYFAPRGSAPGENSFYRAPGVWKHRRPVPGARSSGTPRESQAKFRDGTVWGFYKGPVGTAVNMRGKFVLSKNLGYRPGEGAMWLNVVLTSG